MFIKTTKSSYNNLGSGTNCWEPSHGAAEGGGCNIQNFTPISEFRNLYGIVVLIRRIEKLLTRKIRTNLSCIFLLFLMMRLCLLAMIPRSSSPSLDTNELESGLLIVTI